MISSVQGERGRGVCITVPLLTREYSIRGWHSDGLVSHSRGGGGVTLLVA